MNKEDIIKQIEDLDSEIKRIENERWKLKARLIKEFCLYKVGQKARYIREKIKRSGGIWDTTYTKVGEREEILVCVSISIPDSDYDWFRYDFKRLKSDGSLTNNFVHVPRKEIEWLDEFYDKKL